MTITLQDYHEVSIGEPSAYDEVNRDLGGLVLEILEEDPDGIHAMSRSALIDRLREEPRARAFREKHSYSLTGPAGAKALYAILSRLEAAGIVVSPTVRWPSRNGGRVYLSRVSMLAVDVIGEDTLPVASCPLLTVSPDGTLAVESNMTSRWIAHGVPEKSVRTIAALAIKASSDSKEAA